MHALRRSAGVLLHPTSLPDGRLGDSAYRFVDWLQAAGQSWWQVLPLGPPDGCGSPYASASAFAASPALLADPNSRVTDDDRAEFCARNSYWVDSWTGYAGEAALDDQIRFDREWNALRSYAHQRGIGLIGDLPIYVAHQGADQQRWPQFFSTDAVAGVPPDDLAVDGQHWGNPLYDWQALADDNYRWWAARLRRALDLHDLVRIDHFRGFVGYWAIPAGAGARDGHWRPGPGRNLFDAVSAELGELNLIAEDLGIITPDVVELRDSCGFPGMAVLHWAFDGAGDNPHRLENHRERQVVYTGTHDTDTAAGWYTALNDEQRSRVPVDPAEPHWGLIEIAYSSPAALALVPAQDILGLGSEARMNTPGTSDGNWAWQLETGQLNEEAAVRLRKAAARHRR